MPPPNTDFSTAVELGSLPADVTQTDINDGGFNYGAFYKFTAPVGAKVIGAWGYSGNTGVAEYRAACNPYLGPAGSPTLLLDVQTYGVWVQFEVEAGQEYFLAFYANIDTAGPESLRVMVEVAPDEATIPAGSILVNDDGLRLRYENFPLGIYSGTADYTSLKFIPTAAVGEAGDILRNKKFALEDYLDDIIEFYDENFTVYATLSAGPSTNRPRIRTINGTQRWIVTDLGAPPQIRIVDENANVLTTRNLTGVANDLIGIAADNDEVICYFAENLLNNQPIGRYNISTSTLLADLVAGVPNYAIYDILFQDDDTIIAIYEHTTTHDVFVRRYSTAGATLNTYTIGTSVAPNSSFSRLAYANDNPTSFWVMWHPSDGVIRFQSIRVSDGVVLITRNHAATFGGVFNGDPMDPPPTARFGPSQSCPFMIYPSGSASSNGLFILVPNKRDDLGEAIPDPTFRTALMP